MGRCFEFDEVFGLLEEYKEEYKHCIVPITYKTASGIRLGKIVNNIRAGVRDITDEEKAKLNSIGFVWKVHENIPFEEVIRLLEEYKEEYRHCIVPITHKTASGIRLGRIVNRIRNGERKTTPEQKAKLDSIGFVWKVHEIFSFEEVFELLEEYNAEYCHCNVPRTHKTASGIPLGEIVSSIRCGKRKTTPEQKAKLNSIGFVWRVRIRKKQPKGG